MERLTPHRAADSVSTHPSPAGSAATEDEGRQILDDTSAAKLSDKIPAGRVETPATSCSSAGGSTSRVTLDAHLDVRVTRAQFDAARRRAEALGVKPSAWARAVLLDELDDRRAEVEQLRRLGITLNGLWRGAASARQAGDAVTVVVNDDLLEKILVAVTARRAELGDRTRS